MRYDLSLSPGALRLALAVTVTLTHYLPMGGLQMYLPLDGVPVYGFFFLSGYWIAQLWIDKYQNTANPLLTFYLSRSWRIYPIATVSTLLMFALSNRDWSGLVSNLILIGQNGNPQAPTLINPPAWSLAIELQFYAIAPFFVMSMRNTVATVAVLMIGLVFWLIYARGVNQIYLFHFVFLFGLGVAFAQRPQHKLANALAPYSLVAVALCVVGAGNAAIGAFVAQHGLLRLAAIAIGLLGLPYVAASLGKPSHSIDRTLGDLAYPVYLMHWPAMVIVDRWRFGGRAALSVALTLTLGLSLAIHFAFDRPLERMRRGFVAGRMAALPARTAGATAP
jgi:peptidoglycan/LPS O-acetylase OafA/YrhL